MVKVSLMFYLVDLAQSGLSVSLVYQYDVDGIKYVCSAVAHVQLPLLNMVSIYISQLKYMVSLYSFS